jgi:two-component system, chemotaxis family, CheB/CheR fusion protein
MRTRVLIADDNADAVLTLSTLLDGAGYDVRGVHTGTEVLPAVSAFHPDAVLLDIKMPGLSGYEVARRIRLRYGDSRPKLIALSGHYRKESDRLLAHIVGFDHHLSKPYEFESLLALLPPETD